MNTQLKSRGVWMLLLLVSVFFISGCYTQLAKPEAKTQERIYVENDEQYAESEDEEYQQEYADEEYEEYYDDEEYYEDDELYTDVHVTRRYYHDFHYTGYYPDPWWYDPFFEPYFYDEYTPYSSHVSIHVGYYDPFYYSSYYYPWGYRYRYSGFGFYFGGGCYRRPYRSYAFYNPYYNSGVGHGVVVTPRERRDFSRRGTRRGDDFGYQPNRTVVNRPVVSSSTRRGDGSAIEGAAWGSSTRRRNKEASIRGAKIARNPDSSLKEKKSSRRRRTRDLDKHANDSKPGSKPGLDDRGRIKKKRARSGRIVRSRGKRSYRPGGVLVSKPEPKSGSRTRRGKSVSKQSAEKSSGTVKKRSSRSSKSKVAKRRSSGKAGKKYHSGSKRSSSRSYKTKSSRSKSSSSNVSSRSRGSSSKSVSSPRSSKSSSSSRSSSKSSSSRRSRR